MGGEGDEEAGPLPKSSSELESGTAMKCEDGEGQEQHTVCSPRGMREPWTRCVEHLYDPARISVVDDSARAKAEPKMLGAVVKCKWGSKRRLEDLARKGTGAGQEEMDLNVR